MTWAWFLGSKYISWKKVFGALGINHDWILHPRKTDEWQWQKPPWMNEWRCISYQKLGDVPASSHVSFPEGNVVLYPVPNSARNLHTKKVDRLSRTHSMLHLLCMWSSSRRRSKDTSLKKNIFNWIAKVFRCFHEFPTAQQKPWTLNL